MNKNTNKTRQKKLTRRQKEILDYLKSTIRKRGYPPSIREICEALNLRSSSTVHNHLCNLEEKGYIKREVAKPRSIELLKPRKKPRQEACNSLKNVISTTGGPLKEVHKNKSINLISKVFSELEEEGLMSFLVKGQKFSLFGINEGDIILVKVMENIEKNGLILTARNNNELIIGRYKGKSRKDHYIKTEEPSMINISSTSAIAKIVHIIKN